MSMCLNCNAVNEGSTDPFCNPSCKQQYSYKDTTESYNDFKIKQLIDRKDLMVKYLNLKVSEEDWHGVQDAASDLRDLQVELDTRKEINHGR